MDNPYGTPTDARVPRAPGGPPPAVVTWFRLYSGLMALLYLFVLAGGVLMSVFRASLAIDDETPEQFWLIYGAFLIAMGLVLMVAYGLGAFVPAQSWGWILGAILIGIGMTSCCLLPACIPLLIFWLRPETQQHFGRA